MINLKQAIEDKVIINPLLEKINQGRNEEITNLTRNKTDLKRYIADYKRSIENYEKQLKTVEEKLSKVKDNSWDIKQLIKSINQIKKHKDVDWAFLTKDLELVIQTKMLHQFNPFEEKVTEEKVGRYAFKIKFDAYESINIQVFALDFTAQEHRHPNIMANFNRTAALTTCWGGYDAQLKVAARQGEFYNLVDGLIVFFSSFPHEGGHKPLYWLVWLNERTVEFKQNPWIDLEAIYTIGRKTNPKPVKVKIEKKEVITFKGEEINIKGAMFRSYQY